jgi:hypothetical protein
MMNNEMENLILEGLREPGTAIAYAVGKRLAELYPDRGIVETSDDDFGLFEYARNGHCTIECKGDIYPRRTADWHGPEYGFWEKNECGLYEVTWEGRSLEVVQVSWPEAYCTSRNFWIMADAREVAETFFTTVCAWNSEIRGEILVFEGGGWHKSRELYESVQSATFDNLILPPALKQEIQDDFRQHFEARAEYERYGLPWKRGVLFHGPPGNGKTHTLKALINWLAQPCLYVKSFKSRYDNDHAMIHSVFQRARQTTPCLLVFEDLDSLINDKNRSFFLNEMDGFATNTGIVVIATTNHPERLDPAILSRPSRFDRKYIFGLPGSDERFAYLSLWNEKVQAELKLSDEAIPRMVALTDDFSFAYLKELWLSSMMRWIGGGARVAMDQIMEAQVDVLREQMATMPLSEIGPVVDEDEEEED